MLWFILILVAGLLVLTIYDLTQRKHAILRNFPIVGHFRYWLETIGPELRQYIVTSNNEERPFSRDQRRWVYASSKKENNYFGFGTDEDLESSPNYMIIKHSAFPIMTPHPGEDNYDPHFSIPCLKVLGGYRQRKRAFRPESIVNVSGMSFGSLSSAAVEAINRGVKLVGCLQNTGEGGLSRHHLNGGDLIFQIGTAYFGCRDEQGRFSMDRLKLQIEKFPVKALEVKLSQGAKPGAGGLLPAPKITPELAEARGIPLGKDCVSPARHSEFKDVDSMLDFIETLADATGLPVGIKSAVGDMTFWEDLADSMARDSGRAPDYICIDGGEGGTGAAPLVFTDHVAFPFRLGFARVYREFKLRNLDQNIVFCGSGKLGWPESALFAMAIGCDMINVARSAMLAIGCIQAQRCHTNHCPTGIATQNKWLVRGLDPSSKSARLANYIVTLRKEITLLTNACGFDHPGKIPANQVEVLDDTFGTRTLKDLFGYEHDWGVALHQP